MEKQIILENVSVLASKPGSKHKKKYLKDIDLNIESNSVLSIVAGETYDRHLLGEVISGNTKPTQGRARYIGPYFNDKKDYRGKKIEYITLEGIESIKPEKTVDSFLKEKLLDKKSASKNYESALKQYISERNELLQEKENLQIPEKLAEILFTEKRDKLIEKSELIFDDIKIERNHITSINEKSVYINDINESIKNDSQRLDSDSVYYRELFKGKETSINKQLKKIIKEVKKMRGLERQELRALQNNQLVDRDIENLVYTRTKRELNNLIKYLKGLSMPFVNYERGFIERLDRLYESTSRESFNHNVEERLKEVKKLSTFTNKDITDQLINRIAFIKNIMNPKAPINSRQFNNLLNTLQDKYNNRKNYFNNVIEDINLELEKISLKDKQERVNSMRQVWEHTIISLRFQAQIYRERLIVISDYKKMIDDAALAHNENNTNDIYKLVFEQERTLNKIDIALNRWRFRRQISLSKLISSVRISELNDNKQELLKRINETETKRRFKNNFESYKLAYIQGFINERFERIKDYEPTETEMLKVKKRLEEIEERVNDLQFIISDLEEKIDPENYENKELALTYLLDDISFDTDSLLTQMRGISFAQRQRLSIVKAVLEGKEVIIIEDPRYDLDMNAKSEIANSIKNIVAKHNIMVVLLTGDVKLATTVSDRIAFMYYGTIFEKGELQEIISNPIHPYTKWMVEQGYAQKYGSINSFKVGELNHSIFSPLQNHTINEQHTVFATDTELEKWIPKKV